MKRVIAVAALGAMVFGTMLVGPAFSEQDLPEHGHLLLTGLEFDDAGEPIAYKKCRELANGQPLPLNAHHEQVHFGTAGEALFVRAGNAIVPLAPFPGVPWTNCEEFAAIVLAQ